MTRLNILTFLATDNALAERPDRGSHIIVVYMTHRESPYNGLPLLLLRNPV